MAANRRSALLFVLLAVLASTNLFASIPKNDVLASSALDLRHEVPSAPPAPDDNDALLARALDGSFTSSAALASLSQTRVGASLVFAPLFQEKPSALNRALRKASAFREFKVASDESFCAGDPVNGRDPTGEGVVDDLSDAYHKAADAIDDVVAQVEEGTDDSQWFTRSAGQTLAVASGFLRQGEDFGTDLGNAQSARDVGNAISKQAYDVLPMEEARALIQDWDRLSDEEKARYAAVGVSKTASSLALAKGLQETGSAIRAHFAGEPVAGPRFKINLMRGRPPVRAPVVGLTAAGELGPFEGSGGTGKVYQIPGKQLKAGQPYIGRTKQPTLGDRMSGADHVSKTISGKRPTAALLAEKMTEEEMAGVEALLIQDAGLDNLSNKIPGLNPTKPKNAGRFKAGKRVLRRK